MCTIMQRVLSSFPLFAGHIAKLSAAGFQRVEDVRGLRVSDLSKELGVSASEALEIMRVVGVAASTGAASQTHKNSDATDPTRPPSLSPDAPRPSSGSGSSSSRRGQSALDLLKEEQSQGAIVTFCAKLDGMLGGGGVPIGKLTEFCGPPGIGKTQLCIQLAVDTCIPELFGGVGGESIYIDTEGSFMLDRVASIASSASQHLTSVAESNNDNELKELAHAFTMEKFLSGIHYFRCHSYTELIALVNVLPEFLSGHPKVKLILVDSIAALFRHGFTDMALRNRLLAGLGQDLIKMASTVHLAVVMTNQMTTRIAHGPGEQSCLVPALGESWGHICTNRVVLFWGMEGPGERYAVLYKSPSYRETTVPFQITSEGIRDVPPSFLSQCSGGSSSFSASAASQLTSQNQFVEAELEAEEEGETVEDGGGEGYVELSDLGDELWSDFKDFTNTPASELQYGTEREQEKEKEEEEEEGEESAERTNLLGNKRPHHEP